MKQLYILFLFTPLFLGCDPQIGSTTGPCVHTYLDPILLIESAHSSPSGNAIETISITNVSIDSLTGNLGALVAEASLNIEVTDSSLTCTIPCGFGTVEGQYDFNVSSDGYSKLSLSTFASYKSFVGGCPSSNSGSHTLNLSLNPK